MKKTIVFCFCILLLFSSYSALAEESSLHFLDDNEDVARLKALLVDIGYLSVEDNNSSIFDRKTKTAIENLQKDFELEVTGIATPEIIVICDLLNRLSNPKLQETPSPTPSPTMVPLPNVVGMSEENAKVLLNSRGFVIITNYMFSGSDLTPEGHVINVVRGTSDKMQVTLFISKGPQIITSNHSTWYAWWIYGSDKDEYVLTSPYIDAATKTLYIELDATLNSKYKHKWRGYGTACITDVFDKTVPITVSYEDEIIKRGKTQAIVLIIPLQDLNVEKPTTLSVKIEMYRGNDLQTEESLRMDFTFAWPI